MSARDLLRGAESGRGLGGRGRALLGVAGTRALWACPPGSGPASSPTTPVWCCAFLVRVADATFSRALEDRHPPELEVRPLPPVGGFGVPGQCSKVVGLRGL